MHRRFRGLRWVTVAALVVPLLALLPVSPASANVNGAGFTTDHPGWTDGNGYTSQACENGNPGHTTPAVNCNIYDDKRDVWINGGPSGGQNHLTDGTYFFSVMVPGGQPNPNDGAPKNLSDTTCDPYTCPATNADGSAIPSGDLMTNREFTVSGGKIATSLGDHQTNDQYTNPSGDPYMGLMIQLFPYDDTTNPGGVYILAICQVSGDQLADPITKAVDAKDCKYDAFKVKEGQAPPQGALIINKTAHPTFTREFNWTISKSVDACQVTQQNPNGCQITGSTKTLNYEVVVTKDGGTDGNWKVTGDITVTNPFSFDVNGVEVSDNILDPNVTCDVNNSGNDTVTGNVKANDVLTLPYVCSYSAAPQSSTETNTAGVSWPKVDDSLDAGSASVDVPFTFSNPTVIHDSVDVSDLITSTNPALPNNGFAVGGPVGDFPSGTLSASHTFDYSRTLTVPHNCLTVDNTASFSVKDPDSDADDSGSSSVQVKVCRVPVNTGALTMGFWQNKNGQKIISGANQSALGTWLQGYHPFSDAPTSNVATYVYNIIKAATCSGPASSPCNKMLRAQTLGTALDVYFSDPALGGNKIGAPVPIGGVKIDLTQICHMIDGSGGTATCSGTYEDVSVEFGGATCLSVQDMLTYQNTSDPLADAGAVWYANNKAKQVLAKDAFDAINNKVAFGC